MHLSGPRFGYICKSPYFVVSALWKVVIVCGGSYRRGKSSCGDIDIIITHPDGQRY